MNKELTTSKELPYKYDDKTYRRVFQTACEDYLRQVVNEIKINAANIMENEEHGTLKPLSEEDEKGWNNWHGDKRNNTRI